MSANYAMMKQSHLIELLKDRDREIQRLKNLSEMDMINERNELVRKCNELSQELIKYKIAFKNISQELSGFFIPEIEYSVTGKVITNKG